MNEIDMVRGRGRADPVEVMSIRRRLSAAGLPMRGIHVLIELGIRSPGEVYQAQWHDSAGAPGLRRSLLAARNCGPGTVSKIERWLAACPAGERS